ncbi:MAG: menaquinone biosynthesis protein [Phycisphaerales bacterium]|nr:menaquinone biosynthesis protein [Phycisphaerales bacterium]
MSATVSLRDVPPLAATLCVGAVSYLNTKPLIWGLDELPGVKLKLDIPARLLAGLQQKQFDIAMLPIIDYQRMEGLTLVPSAGIGSDGQTLTVRIFSRVPIDKIEILACDNHSHTSVGLARVILAEHYHLKPQFVDLQSPESTDRAGQAHARLLIGDKVVRQKGDDFPYQLDLGQAWREHTGLPFVFAAWMARPGVQLGDLPVILEQAKRQGLVNIDIIVQRHAAELGWPPELARTYLTRNLQFDIGPRQLEAIRLFYQLAARNGVISSPPRELVIAGV